MVMSTPGMDATSLKSKMVDMDFFFMCTFIGIDSSVPLSTYRFDPLFVKISSTLSLSHACTLMTIYLLLLTIDLQ